jgi:glutamate dehydrogenase (NAD(P)+)
MTRVEMNPADPNRADPSSADPNRAGQTTAALFAYTDDLGPAKVVGITERRTGLRAMVVIDNVAAGPAIGGLRMAPDMSLEVCVRLARAMTLKNAMAGLRHGGAKSGIIADSKMPVEAKEELIRAFADAIRDLHEYIPGPDMGTDETAMGWVLDEIGRAVGLPAELGGLPLDELGATGFGVAIASEVVADRIGLALDGARVVIQGYGNVGRPAARFLAERGAVLVAASDSRGAVADPGGLDIDALDEIKANGGSVAEYGGTGLDRDAVVGIECDIWIPASGPDILRVDNVDQVRTRMVVQGANIPATAVAEQRLADRGIVSVPDFIANAGGVICGAVEYAKGSRAQAFALIEERIRANTTAVIERADASGALPREEAMGLARARVDRAMGLRRRR